MGNKGIYEKRIPELDFLRGLAILLMAGHHTIFDIRHIYGQNVIAFQDTVWFMDWIRPVILFLFLTVSGISCSFSRNNFKRALRVGLFAAALTVVMELVSWFSHTEMHVWFNVFHLLTLGILFYALLTLSEAAVPEDNTKDWRSFLLIILGMLFLYYGTAAAETPRLGHNYLFILGLYADTLPGQADYLPLFPWFGMFLLGAACGRLFYRKKKSLWSQPLRRLTVTAGRPILFLGRHPLAVYAVHQVLLLSVIGLILKLAGRI